VIDPIVLDALVRAGASAEAIAEAVKASMIADMNKAERRRAADRERKRSARASAGFLRTGPENGGIVGTKAETADGVFPEVSPLDNNQPPILPLSVEGEAREAPNSQNLVSVADFAKFYGDYPKHENRKDAEKRYAAARKSGVSHDRIMAGLSRWREKWDADRTERQFIPAPDVWLNKGKFDDFPEPNARAGPSQANGREPRNTIFDVARARLEKRNQRPDDDLPDGEGRGIRRDPLRLLSANGR
jgi:hypothetical protein